MGINLENVIDGAASKPFGYMPFRPGPGVGGHCIPVDPHYLIEYAKSFGFEHRFMKLARDVNKAMPGFVVDLTRRALEEQGSYLDGAKVALLGLSYKPNVDDLRESPSLIILDLLRKEGANVTIYDPFHIKKEHANSLDDALAGDVDAVIIATHHDHYKDLTPETMKKHDIKVLIDSRNMFKDKKEGFKDAGIYYRGVGQS
jgi:UDP-N-acetyl-D-glucosamine dehydrogenase